MRCRLPMLVVVLGFALFLLSGCGEREDSTTTASETGGTMTKAEVIAQGDAACTQSKRKAKPLVNRFLSSPDLGERAGILRQLASAAEPTVQLLATLRPPPDGRQALDDYVLLASEQIVVVRRAADRLVEGDRASARALLASALEEGAKLQGVARGYGFKVCGSELDGS